MAKSYFKYTIKSNDSLIKIANRFKTSVDEIMKMNPSISNPNKINDGQVIQIKKI